MESIYSDAEQVAMQVKSTILSDGKEEIVRLIVVEQAQLRTIEERLRRELSNSIAELTLERIRVQFENKLTSSLQQQLIDRNISILAEENKLSAEEIELCDNLSLWQRIRKVFSRPVSKKLVRVGLLIFFRKLT